MSESSSQFNDLIFQAAQPLPWDYNSILFTANKTVIFLSLLSSIIYLSLCVSYDWSMSRPYFTFQPAEFKGLIAIFPFYLNSEIKQISYTDLFFSFLVHTVSCGASCFAQNYGINVSVKNLFHNLQYRP